MFVRNFSRGHQGCEMRSNGVERAELVAKPLVTGERRERMIRLTLSLTKLVPKTVAGPGFAAKNRFLVEFA